MDLEYIKRAWQGSQAARAKAESKRKMYQHDWTDQLKVEILRLFLAQNAEKLNVRADTTLNMMRSVIDELAVIYSRPVSRRINETELVLSAEVDMAFDLASKWTFCMGETLIRPLWLGDRIGVDVVPRDRFHAIPDPRDRMKLRVALIEHRNRDGRTSKIELWTDDVAVMVDASFKVLPRLDAEGNPLLDVEGKPDVANPYGRIPWLVAHNRYPSSGFWDDTESDALVAASLAIGVGMTDHAHLRHLQSYKQLAIRTDGKKGSSIAKLASDPASVLLLRGAAANAQVLDMQADLRGHLDTLLTAADQVFHSYGIRPDVVKGTKMALSGYALELKLHKQQMVWERLRNLWRLSEREFWAAARDVLYVDSGGAMVVPEGELHIEYPEVGPGRDPEAIGTATRSDVNSGIISRREALRIRGYSPEAIDQIESELLEQQVAAAAVSAPPLMPADAAAEGV